MHPAVVAYTEEWLAGLTAEVAVIDAIKLFEAGMAGRCDEVWVITCPPAEQARRLQQNRGLSAEEALAAHPRAAAAGREGGPRRRGDRQPAPASADPVLARPLCVARSR